MVDKRPNLTVLPIIPAENGWVRHALRVSDKDFVGFGEVYFSAITHLAVRAWKKHNRVTCNLVVISGTVKFVIRINDLEFEEYILSSENNTRLTIPCGYWFGFQGVGLGENLIMNVANEIHDPDEVQRKSCFEFKYLWGTLDCKL